MSGVYRLLSKFKVFTKKQVDNHCFTPPIANEATCFCTDMNISLQ